MAVRDRETILCISAYRRCISFRYVDLFHTITDNCSCLLFIKACPDIAPVISSIQCHFFPAFIFSCIELHLDILRALSVLIIIIRPCFCYGYACLSRCITVRDVISAYCCLIIFDSILCHCITDQLAACILRQICESVLPVILCCYFLTVYFCSICKQVYCNAARTFSILVITIIPGLCSAYIYCFCIFSISKCCY